MVKSKFWLVAVILLSSLLFFAKPIVWQTGFSDSAIYSATVDYFKGDAAAFHKFAVDAPGFGARPLWPLLAAPLSFLFSNYVALALVNLLFWLGTVFLLYKLVAHLYDKKTGFLAGLLYSASLVPIAYSSRPLTEAGSYFFLILLIYYVEVCVREYNTKELLGLGVLLALALLHKESALFLLLYVFVDIAYRWGWFAGVRKGLAVLVSFALSLIPVTLWKAFTNTSWFRVRGGQINRQTLTWTGIPALLFRSFVTFHIGWLFAVYEVWQDKDKHRRVFYAKCLLALTPIVLYAWLFAPPFSPRFAHFWFPMVIPAFAFGLQKWVKDKKWNLAWIWVIVIVYYAISYLGASLFPTQDVNKDTNLLQLVWEEIKNRL